MKRSISLRVKILVLLLFLMGIFGLACFTIVSDFVKSHTARKVIEKAEHVIYEVSQEASNYILGDDILGLESYLENKMFMDKKVGHSDFVYFFVQDVNGRVLAHTFGERFPVELIKANKLNVGEDERIMWLETEKGLILDIAVPVQNGSLGVARVGLSAQAGRDGFNKAFVLLIFIFYFLIAAFVVTLFIKRWFASLEELGGAVERIKEGDLTKKIKVTSNDEIGRFIGVFNDMTEELRKAITEKSKLLEIMDVFKHGGGRFVDVINYLDIGVHCATLGANGTFIDANTAMVKLFGVDSKDELMRHNISELYVDSAKRSDFINKLLETGEIKDDEAELISLKGRRFWGSVTAMLRVNDKGEKFCYGLVEDITEYKDVQDRLKRNFDIQTAINRILSVSFEKASLMDILEYALNDILDISWLALESRGAIFLVEDDPNKLILKVQRNLAVPLQAMCQSVSFGQCLCGRAAQTGGLVFSDHVDERHEIAYTNMPPHGHYCVPLVSSGGKLLGVVTLYVAAGYRRDQKEEGFLMTLAHVLATVIERKQIENNFMDKIEEVDKLNHFMIGREKRVIELKKEVDDVLKESGRKTKYNIS